MGSGEEEARRDAVARVLAGEPPGKVAADLGRTDRWVRKWMARYDPKDDSWSHDRSRAPITQARKTPEDIERIVLEIRSRLMDDPWSQVGAVAIAWEMQKLGVTPPERWTIERILARAKVAKRRARNRYVAKETPYPSGPLLVKPNALHEIDLVGPRHLEGGIPFYALNAVDLGRRRAAIENLKNKEEWEVARGLASLWRRLGVPTRARFDNGLTLQGRGRHLAVPVWTCLALGARVRFIPFAEPWRKDYASHCTSSFSFDTTLPERLRHLCFFGASAPGGS